MKKEEKKKENGRRLPVQAENAKIADREEERGKRHRGESGERAESGIEGDDYGTDRGIERG